MKDKHTKEIKVDYKYLRRKKNMIAKKINR